MFWLRTRAGRLLATRVLLGGWLLRIDVAVARLYNQVRLINSDFDLAPLTGLAHRCGVISDAVLPAQFISNLGEGIREAQHRIAAKVTSAGLQRNLMQVLVRAPVVTRT